MRFEISRRADDRRPVVPGYPNGHHVLLDELPELNAGVEAGSYEIVMAVRGRDVEHDVRVIARELAQLRGEHRHSRMPRHPYTHASGRSVTEAGNLFQRSANVAERWT